MIAILLTIGAPVLMTPALARDVTVDGAQRHQTIGGFGTCLIAWNGRFRDLYRTETFRKPFWITEGDTGGPDWPAPIEKGIDNAPHNALVAGNCSAFVPWQITERRKSTHGLMVMDTYTSKTYTAMHYTRFVHPGAVRVCAEPGFGLSKLARSCRIRRHAAMFSHLKNNPLEARRSFQTEPISD